MRLVLAALLVLTLVGTATATEYLWFEVIGSTPDNLVQGPENDLSFDAMPGDAFHIGIYLSDAGAGTRGFGMELSSDGTIGAANAVVNLWDNHPVNNTYDVPATTILELTSNTVGIAPVLGSGTLIAEFDLFVGAGPDGPVGIGGGWTYAVALATGHPVWGGYYHDSYIGDYYQGTGVIGGCNHGYAGTAWADDVITINRIPEPATLVLLGLGAVALLRRR